MRQLLENLDLLFLRQVFENVDGVVGIELAHALGDGLGRKLVEDLLAHRVVDFGERGKVEILAHQFDELGPQFGIERLDQIAGIGFVQVADETAQRRAFPVRDGVADPFDEIGADGAVLVAQVVRRSSRPVGHLFLVEHAGLAASHTQSKDVGRLYARTGRLAIARKSGDALQCRASRDKDQLCKSGAAERTRTSKGFPASTSS